MSKRAVEIDLPDDALAAMDEDRMSEVAREAIIVRLYEQAALSSGRAARLLGISRVEFLNLLGQYGVSYFDDSTDLREELGRALTQ